MTLLAIKTTTKPSEGEEWEEGEEGEEGEEMTNYQLKEKQSVPCSLPITNNKQPTTNNQVVTMQARMTLT